MDLTQKLTENWRLSELLVTNHREFLSQQQNPPQEVVDNLKALTINILQPLRTLMGRPVQANDGYRCPELNKVVGGALNSQHMCQGHAAAADLIDHEDGNLALFEKIRTSTLPFDQLITECPDKNAVPAWVHVSYDPTRNRRQVLRAHITGHHLDGTPIFEYQNF